MKNPLRRRLLKELKTDIGKYLVIFIFIFGMISIVSGFLVANNSMTITYNEGYEKYNIEDGNFELKYKASDNLISSLEEEDLKIYSNIYFEEETKEVDSTLRVFINREKVNKVSIVEGNFPIANNEISIDRLYANNNSIKLGDTITLNEKELCVVGFIALPDYSSLYSSPTDMLFDAVKFGVSVMSEDGFNDISSKHIYYSYSFIYNEEVKDDDEAYEKSNDFLKVLYTKSLLSLNKVENYIPAYINPAIVFVKDDITKDGMLFTIFLYIVILIIAFIFAIMTSSTINKEAMVIGTLRASGYSKGELVRHYLAMPMIVVVVACILGNIFGYTLFKDYMASMYYGSYSLPNYVTIFNFDALLKTTIIPFIIMFVINLVMLENKLSLSPLKFLRHDLKKNNKSKVVKLNKKISFIGRFRLRVIIQNIPSYVMIVFGVFLANFILLFGFGLTPLFEHYEKQIVDNMICEYQIVLNEQVETNQIGCEKYSVDSFKIERDNNTSETVTLYGIVDKSEYIDIDFNDGVYISSAYAKKYKIDINDTIEVKENYGINTYTFKVDGIYYYPSMICVFMSNDLFINTFDLSSNYFNGYFTNEIIEDIDEDDILSTISQDDLTKASRQMILSLGNVVNLFAYFGLIMNVLIIYLLSKVIIEKNTQSISMTKILGYTRKEIIGLYTIPTTIIVVIAFILTMPLCDLIMSKIIPLAFSDSSGYLEYYSSFWLMVLIIGLGILSYLVVMVSEYFKIGRIKKSDALKNME